MMKFFRKYNKQLLAVFASALLVFWLGGTALQQAFSPDPSKQIIARTATGEITYGDQNLAEHTTRLQRMVNLRWDAWAGPYVPRDEQLDIVDWILLQREAKRFGIVVRPTQAKRMLTQGRPPVPESYVEQVAVKLDVTPEMIYQAAAEYFSVAKMIQLMQISTDVYGRAMGPVIPEAQLRTLARNMRERASVELVLLPGDSFIDSEETFAESEVQEQFDSYKDQRAVEGGLNFGYYLDPRVRVQYIKINPAEIKEGLTGDDAQYQKSAYDFWTDNREDPMFRKPPEVLGAERAALAEANSNGAPLPEVAPFYEKFAEAREVAIEAIKKREAKAEADRIAGELGRLLAEPWFDIVVERTVYKPAPDKVKMVEYYDEVVAALRAKPRYSGGVEVGLIDWVTQDELRKAERIGVTYASLGREDKLPLFGLAFMVEGLAEIPVDVRDRSLYLSQWETSRLTLGGVSDAMYLFRVVGVQPGRVPDSVDEVRDQVVQDLRKLHGMERARERAQRFAVQAGELGLKEAWDADQELADLITPDEGNYYEPPPFAREALGRAGALPTVAYVGQVTQDFVTRAFELAAAGGESGVAVIDLPDSASVVVMKGRQLLPLYEEEYLSQRSMLQSQLRQMQGREMLSYWINPKQIRERNQFEFGRGET